MIDYSKYNLNKITSDMSSISHNMIEVFMICTNEYVGNYLYKHKNKMFVRTQKESDIKKDIKNMPEYAKTFLNVSAVYEYIDTFTNNNYLHYSLSVSNYCHVSSPMRRVIDMLNHLILHDIPENKYNKLIDMINMDELNQKLKIQKRLYSAYELINHLKITNIFKAYIFERLDGNKALLVLYDEANNFKKMIKVELPDVNLDINITEIDVELYYNSYKFNSTWFPFYIKIII